jgi:hypothetical protein
MAGDSVAAAATPDSEFTETQIKDAQLLMDELPRIETALKTFLSLKIAQSLSTPAASASPSGTTASSSGYDSGVNPPPALLALDSASLQGCARAFLKTLNSLELPPVTAWGQQKPQGEKESAMEFMTRLAEYKVAYALWSRCHGAGHKPAKLLGKTFLRRVYAVLVEQLFEGGAGPAVARVEESQLRHFVDSFGATLLADDGADTASDAALVWASNVNAAVNARQQARQEAAADRAKRATTNEDFSAELRAALGCGPAANMSESSVQIEELAE